jgi:hypothetical protein
VLRRLAAQSVIDHSVTSRRELRPRRRVAVRTLGADERLMRIGPVVTAAGCIGDGAREVGRLRGR